MSYEPVPTSLPSSQTVPAVPRDLKIRKVEVAGITVTALLVTAAVVVSVVAFFFTLGTSGLITIAVLGGVAVLSASGTGIYSCFKPLPSSNTSETAPKTETAHERKVRIEAKWESFANIEGNADQFIGAMVDLIDSEYKAKVKKEHPDAIYRTTGSVDLLLDLQSQIVQFPDVLSGIRLISESFSSSGDILILTNLLKKFIGTLSPEAASSVSDATLEKLDNHLIDLCAFGEPPVLPLNLFLGWGALVIFGSKKRSKFLQKIDSEKLFFMHEQRLKMGRPTGLTANDFEPTHPHAD